MATFQGGGVGEFVLLLLPVLLLLSPDLGVVEEKCRRDSGAEIVDAETDAEDVKETLLSIIAPEKNIDDDDDDGDDNKPSTLWAWTWLLRRPQKDTARVMVVVVAMAVYCAYCTCLLVVLCLLPMAEQ